MVAGARPRSGFERKARPVRCFRVLHAGLEPFEAPTRAEDLIYNIAYRLLRLHSFCVAVLFFRDHLPARCGEEFIEL